MKIRKLAVWIFVKYTVLGFQNRKNEKILLGQKCYIAVQRWGVFCVICIEKKGKMNKIPKINDPKRQNTLWNGHTSTSTNGTDPIEWKNSLYGNIFADS